MRLSIDFRKAGDGGWGGGRILTTNATLYISSLDTQKLLHTILYSMFMTKSVFNGFKRAG